MRKNSLIKKLREASIDLSNIEVSSGKKIEIVVLNDGIDWEDGFTSADVDYDATESLREQVSKVLGWGGFKTGYGSWILEESYAFDGHDYCDKANPIHY